MKPQPHVFDLFGHSPDVSGQMTSVVANLMPEIQYINTLRGTCLVMEQKRADPVLMTEAVDTKADNVEGINYDYYADGDMQDTSSDNRFSRDRHNVSALRNQQSMYDAFFAGGRPASVGGNVLGNLVNVPLGQKIVNVPMQTGRGDIKAQVKTFQDVVCGVMGIPRGHCLMSDTPHKSDEEGTHQTFKKTILGHGKLRVQAVCEQVYSIIYAEDIQATAIVKSHREQEEKKNGHCGRVRALKKAPASGNCFPDFTVPFTRGIVLHTIRTACHYMGHVLATRMFKCLPTIRTIG